MNLRLKKSAAAVALVLSAGLTLAACSGDDADAGKGGDTSSVGKDASTELTKENFFTEVTKAQQEAGTSHVEMAFGVGGQEVKASGDVAVGTTPAESAMSMTMDLGGQGKVDMRLVDGVLYMNMGPMTENKFTKIDLTDDSNPVGKEFGGLLDSVDPSKQLEQLQEAITGFEQKGKAEKLDGVEATPYVVTVDSSKISEELGAAAQGAQVPDELVYTMYVGPDNLPRRISMDVSGTKMTMDYSKWGEDVDIKAPAKDQVSDVDLSKMGGA
jgi:predicted small secreted protein